MDHLTRWDVFIGCLCATTPLLAVFVAFHLQNISERRKDRKQRCKAEEKLEVLLVEYPLHDHIEQQGPLKAEGVRWPANATRHFLHTAPTR